MASRIQFALTADVQAKLPLASRAFRVAQLTQLTPVFWGRHTPLLPPDLQQAVAQKWLVQIESDAAAPNAVAAPAFAALYSHARAEQVLRAFALRTNLVLPGVRALLVGDGPVAAALTAALTRLGARVIVSASDPQARLVAHLAGHETTDLLTYPHTDLTVVTGEGNVAVPVEELSGLLLDASARGDAITTETAGTVLRPGVTQIGQARTWSVAVPSPVATDLDTASALDWHIADLVVAQSILTAARAAADELATIALDVQANDSAGES